MTRKKDDLLPHSNIAEEGLLGSFIHSPEKVYEKCLFRNVTEKWFYHSDNGKIFNGLCDMKKAGMFLDSKDQKASHVDYLLPVTQYLSDNADRLGIVTTNIQMVTTQFYTSIPTSSNVDYYIDLLQEKAGIRYAVIDAQNLVQKLKRSITLQEVSDHISRSFLEAKELCSVTDKKNWKREEMMGFIEEIEGIASKTRKPDVMPFFLPSIDEEVGGMKRGEMCIIQAPTSGGKSICGGMIITKNAVDHGRKAAVFTFEMPTRQYLKRTTASLGNISLASMRDGSFNKHELNSFMDIQTKIEKARLEFYDVQRCKPIPSHIEAAVRREKKNGGLDIILVDHLNLIQFPGSKSSRKDQDLTDFANGLKLLALELEIAVILLAQSNKDGTVFDSTQVESACDFSFSLTPTFQTVGGIKKVNGTDGLWINKMREGRRGWKIPLYMNGKFAQIYEPETKS